MLVLSRKQKQQIRIGDDITVTILKIKGQGVRLGVEAPRGVRVLRGELKRFDLDEVDASGEDESTSQTAASTVDWAATPPWLGGQRPAERRRENQRPEEQREPGRRDLKGSMRGVTRTNGDVDNDALHGPPVESGQPIQLEGQASVWRGKEHTRGPLAGRVESALR